MPHIRCSVDLTDLAGEVVVSISPKVRFELGAGIECGNSLDVAKAGFRCM